MNNRNAELSYEPYPDPDEPFPDWAPYVRLAQCPTHGLEAVTGSRTIHTGDVGVLACGAIVTEDVF